MKAAGIGLLLLFLVLGCGRDPIGIQPVPPTASVLYAGVNQSGDRVEASWTRCPDDDFESYSLWRSETPGISGNPSQAVAVFSSMNPLRLTFSDADVLPGRTLHYALETRNAFGLKSWSNEVSVTIPEPDPKLSIFFIDPTWGSLSGDAMLIRTPDGRNYLVDGGSSSPAWSCGTDVIIPLLDSLGITFLNGIVATHPHSDHIGGLIDVLGHVPVGKVWDCGWPGAAGATYEQFLEAVSASGAEYVVARRGMELDWGPSLTVKVLHPTSSLGSGSMNNASIVLRVTFDQVSCLLAGDLETKGGETSVLAAFDPSELTAQVLKVGHHGSGDATGNPWLNAVRPSYGAIEVGAGNPYGHPHPELLARLTSHGVSVLRTDILGTFRIETDGAEINVFP